MAMNQKPMVSVAVVKAVYSMSTVYATMLVRQLYIFTSISSMTLMQSVAAFTMLIGTIPRTVSDEIVITCHHHS